MSLDKLLERKLIMPHFNSLNILRESIKILAASKEWINDDQLIARLNQYGIVHGRDPRRARNIYEASLFFGLADRKKIAGEMRYHVSEAGLQLTRYSGEFRPSGEEQQFFITRLQQFKIPNAAMYEEPSMFKEYYLQKRIRPLYVLLESIHVANSLGIKPDLRVAVTSVLAEKEDIKHIRTLMKNIISQFKRFNSNKTPFRDAFTLLSWCRQLGLINEFTLTDLGTQVLGSMRSTKPIWWVDVPMECFTILLLLDHARKEGVTKIDSEHVIAVTSEIVRQIAYFKKFADLSTLPHIRLEENTVEVAYPIAADLYVDVPYRHRTAITNWITNSLRKIKVGYPKTELEERISLLAQENERLRKELEKAQSEKPFVMEIVKELVLLARRDKEVIEKFGSGHVPNEFEKCVWYLFNLLNFDVIELGHKTREPAPDAIVINRYPTLLKQGPAEAVFVECKASESPYRLGRTDIREIEDYIEMRFSDTISSRAAVPKILIIISSAFANNLSKRVIYLESKLYGMKVILVEAVAFAQIINLFISEPNHFNEGLKAQLFQRLLATASSSTRKVNGNIRKLIMK